MSDFLDKYRRLNTSFESRLIFHVGVNAGFFSEFNNMVLAILYCLDNKIQFCLYSADANFSYEEGWNDYFLPFCPESKDPFHSRYNKRFHHHTLIRKLNPAYYLSKKKEKYDYLTFELWYKFRDRENENKHYDIPELGISGNLRTACRQIIDKIWKYNEQTETEINQQKAPLLLPKKYIGMHIRSGDKFVESNLLNIDVYFRKLKEISPIKDVFVLTDNYEIIHDINTHYPDYTVYTLCGEEERGYFHKEFHKRDKTQVKNAHLKLFASVDLLSNADYFIGTLSSNPGMYLGMRMPEENVFSVDLAEWQIW
ncbi:hypothetical protein LJC52_02050 [Bacteroidales bacterium OttesenSCG-928-A17]|nr:hypothetical protein [Bacteroidales bacterium OttesenSCG-928-A17]